MTPAMRPSRSDDTELTPIEAERAIRRFVNQLNEATDAYTKAGRELVDAKRDHRRAVVVAAFRDDCPKVARGGATVGDRDLWIERETQPKAEALFAAEIARETALEAMRSARSELQGAMAVNASVREAYKTGVA